MDLKKFFVQLNIIGQCRGYNLPLWQCPQFLFVIMGTVIIATEVVTYALGTRYIADPNTVLMIVVALTSALFIMTYTIVRGLERLAEANRLKTEFINIVSHQLRSPLSNLKWATEFLASGRLGRISDKQEEYYKILEENTARMGELVSDLLFVSRIEQGRLLFQQSEFSFEDLTKEVLNSFKPIIGASNVEVKFINHSAKALPKVLADSARMKVVVENLLDNAVRYIKGKGEVKIELKEKGDKLLFTIKDTGVGIPRADQKHIFQKFFRSSNVVRHQTQGSGLGLYIAKFIIEKSGGKIWFESQENKGTTFFFILPTKRKN